MEPAIQTCVLEGMEDVAWDWKLGILHMLLTRLGVVQLLRYIVTSCDDLMTDCFIIIFSFPNQQSLLRFKKVFSDEERSESGHDCSPS